MIKPNTRIIQNFLEHLFAKAREEYPQGLIEIRYGKETKLNNTALFGNNPKQVEEAAKFAESMNEDGHNIYVGVNPRKPNTKGFPSDTDVEIAFWQFADLDRSDALAAAGSKMVDCPPTMTVTTGTIPTRRAHLYWELEEPVRNLDEWTTRQRGVADRLDGDSVINPSRVMRLAGTVAYPPQKKMERGYAIEISSFRTDFPDERSPVAPEIFARAYPAQPMLPAHTDVVIQPTELRNNLQAMVQKPLTVDEYVAFCQADNQWHNHMIRLVASLVHNGRTDIEILALAHEITLPGYSVEQTRKEMRAAIPGARRKYGGENGRSVELIDPETAYAISTVDAFDFDETQIPTRPWMIPGVMLRGYTHILVAPGGSGKSLFTLQLAISLATGEQWGGWVPRRRHKCLIVNVEDDLNEQRRRLAAARKVMNPDMGLLKGMIHLADDAQSIVVAKVNPQTKGVIATPLVEQLRAYITENQIDTLIVDPFTETFEGDENSNSEIKWAMKVWRDEIARPCNCAVYLVHHTTKYANRGAGDANIIRGAGAIVNSVRIAATLMPMTSEEAQALGVDPDSRNRYVRYDDAKANQSLVSGKGHWFEKVSIELNNGGGLGFSDEVGALVPWSPPDAFDGISTHALKIAAERIHRGLEDDDGQPTGEKYTLRRGGQSDRRWAGKVLMECLGIEAQRASTILKTWQRNELLDEVPYDDPVQRKSRNGVVVDMAKVMQLGAAG